MIWCMIWCMIDDVWCDDMTWCMIWCMTWHDVWYDVWCMMIWRVCMCCSGIISLHQVKCIYLSIYLSTYLSIHWVSISISYSLSLSGSMNGWRWTNWYSFFACISTDGLYFSKIMASRPTLMRGHALMLLLLSEVALLLLLRWIVLVVVVAMKGWASRRMHHNQPIWRHSICKDDSTML